MSKEMDEKLKLAHKVVDADDQAGGKTCVTLPWYNLAEPEIS